MAKFGNANAASHGASSERHIRTRAARLRRNVLRQLRLRVADLDPIGRQYLDQVVRLRTRVEFVDEYLDAHGMIREDGEVEPVTKLYTSLHNSLRLATARLDDHLRERGIEPSMVARLQSQARGDVVPIRRTKP